MLLNPAFRDMVEASAKHESEARSAVFGRKREM